MIIDLSYISLDAGYILENIDREQQYDLGSISLINFDDTNKSIKYFELSANQNDPKAQYFLGIFCNKIHLFLLKNII